MTTVGTSAPGRISGLLGAAHPGPAVAVTVLAGLLAVAEGAGVGTTLLVVLAVLAGQLSIGWSNDLIDAGRDRAVGRTDKPLASGAVDEHTARIACGVALATGIVLPLTTGLAAGLVGLLVVAGGWAYNLGFKSTAASWVPYAVAFGALPVFTHLAAHAGDLPAAWLPLAGALLGVGAHLLNVLPDLADDAATGVRGMPHRLGARASQVAAVVVLVSASLVILVGSGAVGSGASGVGAVVAVLAVAALAAAALLGSGRGPFRAAVGIALVDVIMVVCLR